jgi:hypothetical protein
VIPGQVLPELPAAGLLLQVKGTGFIDRQVIADTAPHPNSELAAKDRPGPDGWGGRAPSACRAAR